MTDSYGDGWNGNSIDVLVNGQVVLDNATFTSSENSGDYAIRTFSVNDGDQITTIWNGGGSYGYETSYSILNNIAESLGSGAQTSISSPINATCAEGCAFTLRMIDSYGDGWNGNSIDVLVNGQVVLDNATFTSSENSGDYALRTFIITDGDLITTIWNGGGSYGYETSYKILDNTGAQVGSGAQSSITTPINGICGTPPEPPTNDTCLTAESISCGDVKTGDTTLASVAQTLESCNGVSLNTAPGVWYAFEGTGDEIFVTVDTNGSSYDTKLGVFTGDCGALTCVDGDDDGGEGLQSELSFLSEVNSTYYIYVTGFSSNAGAYTLSLACALQASMDSDCNTVYYGWPAESTAQLTVSASYGVPPYTYAWDNGISETTSSVSVSPSVTTVYTATITDANGDTAQASTTVIAVDVTCGNSNNGKVLVCHKTGSASNPYETLCIAPSAVQNHLDHGDDLGECGSYTCETPPSCDVTITSPENGSTDVSIDADISWTDASLGFVTGYEVTIGTTPGGSDIAANLNVGNVSSYDPGTLNYETTYYITVAPTNGAGSASGCLETSFTTENDPTPVNNTCDGALEILCGDIVNGDTTFATDTDEPDWCGDITIGPSNNSQGVWYTILGSGKEVTLDLSGSDFDTRVTVHTGSCGNFTCIAGDDDGGDGLDSLVSFNSEVGITYYVYVYGYGTSSGTFVMNVSCVEPPEATYDICAGALPIACGENVFGSTVGATNGGDPTSYCGTTPGYHGVWYTFVGDGSTYTTASTCGTASFDTKINVYSGSCNALVCEGGNDDVSGCSGFTSEVTFDTVSGTTYYILVSSYSSSSSGEGEFELTLTCANSGRMAGPDFGIHPNPSKTSTVHLDLRDYLNQDLNIQVLDVRGNVINREELLNLSQPTHTMQLNNAVNGMYFVRVQTNRGVTTKKLIIAY